MHDLRNVPSAGAKAVNQDLPLHGTASGKEDSALDRRGNGGPVAKRKRIRVSDHALMRYIERKLGLSLDPFRREIETIVATAYAVGARSIKKDGLEYCLSPDGTVVTVTPYDRLKRQRRGSGKRPPISERAAIREAAE